MACFCNHFGLIKVTLVKRRIHINRSSLADMVDVMMAQTGINKEQACVALDTIVHYIRKHPGEPFNKLMSYLFGNDKESGKSSLN